MKLTIIRAARRRCDRTFIGICFAIFVVVSTSSKGALVPVIFGGATNFIVGNPNALAVADLNRDAKLDLITVNNNPNSVSVLAGVGNGSFTGRVDYAISNFSTGLAIGRLNSDSNLDIVAIGFGGAYVLFGDGVGGFTVHALSNNLSSSVIRTADFNGDGKLDLATLGIAIALGRGDGSFAPATNYPVSYAGDLAIGDLNGDGKPDLVSVHNDYTYSPDQINVRSNKGDGTFSAPTIYLCPGAGDYHYSLALADFNGDGKLDLATVNYYAGSVTTWLNLGNGLLGHTNNCSLGFGSPTSLVAGDFNLDGKADLIVGGSYGIQVLLGNGDGTFVPQNPLSQPSTAQRRSLVVGDFDGDGKPDIAFTASSNLVTVLLNRTLPVLEIARVAGHVQITWPSSLGVGYTLESSTNLSVNNSWQPFPYPPVFIADRSGVADFVEGNKFYRLRR